MLTVVQPETSMPIDSTMENFMVSRHLFLAVATVACLGAFSSACDSGGNGNPDAGGVREVINETCPSSCDRDPGCTLDRVESCCACVATPGEDVVAERCRSTDCDEYSGSGAVDVGCFAEDTWGGGLPEGTVRLAGVVDVYATGGSSSDNIHVEVYRMNEDASLGARVGQFLTSTADAPCDEARDEQLASFLIETGEEAENCPGICQEQIPDTQGDCRDLGFYTIDDVPTHVPLVIVTYGDALWRHLYAYNIMFFDDDAVEMEIDGLSSPTIYYKVKVLSNGDFSAIPITAGMPGGIPESHGAVAGEVHDCNDVRIRNVQVGISPDPETLIYFNGNESKPYPDGSRRIGTNSLGLFAGLDIDPEDNPVHVSAIGNVDGELVSFGWATVRVYPGSVTIVTLRGTRPGIDEF
jgi:hypothetical protein